MLRWLRRPDPRPGATPREVLCAWGAARNRLRKVREMGPAFAALPPLEAHEPLPGEESLQRAMEALKGMAKAQRAREDRERVRAWREWLDHAWSLDQGAVYRWLGGDGFTPPVVFLTREDGTPTSNVAEMDAPVRRAWAPINQKYEHTPEPCPEAFLRAYGRHIRRVPMHLWPLTGERLCRRLRRMKPSALGLDGRPLPPPPPPRPGELAGSAATAGGGPGALASPTGRGVHGTRAKGRPPRGAQHPPADGAVHRLPPVGGAAPGGGHPLAGVLGTPPGLWVPAGRGIAGRRSGDAPPTGALPPPQMDGRGDEHRCKKCFDLIPQAVVLRVAAELGMAPAVCRALGAMYRQLPRSFKIAGCLGLWWRTTNGILQGCPLSVILVNVLMGIWKEEIDSLRQHVCAWTRQLPPARRLLPAANPEDPPQVILRDEGRGYVAVGPKGYADDTEAVAPGTGALRQTTPATERWLRLTGQSVNVDKSTSVLEGEDDPAPLLLLGEAIPRSQEFKRLGVGIRVGQGRRDPRGTGAECGTNPGGQNGLHWGGPAAHAAPAHIATSPLPPAPGAARLPARTAPRAVHADRPRDPSPPPPKAAEQVYAAVQQAKH